MLFGVSTAWGSETALQAQKAKQTKQAKTAIVLAHFGTTVPSALKSITNITETVRNAYPGTEVRTTFTSNIIRKVWKKRQAEPQKWLDQGVPAEILHVKNFIATVGDLLEDGYTNIVVQPSHMFYMEQSYDLQQYVDGLASIRTMKERWKPFANIVMGRPALGGPGDRYPYHEDIDAVVATLAGDAAETGQAGAMLVYLGHGNENWSTGIYAETEKKMRAAYPEVATFIGVVEGTPSLDDLLVRMRQEKTRKIVLRPFMIVAGDHAVNDMAGSADDSWKSILTKAGFTVEPILEGLGSNRDFARIFVSHIADAAREKGIELK
jgi:sirohydrochlorin cobaltochelatase